MDHSISTLCWGIGNNFSDQIQLISLNSIGNDLTRQQLRRNSYLLILAAMVNLYSCTDAVQPVAIEGDVQKEAQPGIYYSDPDTFYLIEDSSNFLEKEGIRGGLQREMEFADFDSGKASENEEMYSTDSIQEGK